MERNDGMDGIEKLLRSAADMEALPPGDRLSRLVSRAAGKESGELDEEELELVSAAGAQAYQKFLRRLDRKDRG